MSDDDRPECPLCLEALDASDKNFFPCPCGYQVCGFCWHHIRNELNGLCPACRRKYSDNVQFNPPTSDELQTLRSAAKKLRSEEPKTRIVDDRKPLANLRVIQKNLVYVIGLPPRMAEEATMKKADYFGKYGKIAKVMVNKIPYHGGNALAKPGVSYAAYITFYNEDDAFACIQSVDGMLMDGRTLKAFFGTTKYCSQFLRNLPCKTADCLYLHEVNEEHRNLSFGKDEPLPAYHEVILNNGVDDDHSHHHHHQHSFTTIDSHESHSAQNLHSINYSSAQHYPSISSSREDGITSDMKKLKLRGKLAQPTVVREDDGSSVADHRAAGGSKSGEFHTGVTPTPMQSSQKYSVWNKNPLVGNGSGVVSPSTSPLPGQLNMQPGPAPSASKMAELPLNKRQDKKAVGNKPSFGMPETSAPPSSAPTPSATEDPSSTLKGAEAGSKQLSRRQMKKMKQHVNDPAAQNSSPDILSDSESATPAHMASASPPPHSHSSYTYQQQQRMYEPVSSAYSNYHVYGQDSVGYHLPGFDDDDGMDRGFDDQAIAYAAAAQVLSDSDDLSPPPPAPRVSAGSGASSFRQIKSSFPHESATLPPPSTSYPQWFSGFSMSSTSNPFQPPSVRPTHTMEERAWNRDQSLRTLEFMAMHDTEYEERMKQSSLYHEQLIKGTLGSVSPQPRIPTALPPSSYLIPQAQAHVPPAQLPLSVQPQQLPQQQPVSIASADVQQPVSNGTNVENAASADASQQGARGRNKKPTVVAMKKSSTVGSGPPTPAPAADNARPSWGAIVGGGTVGNSVVGAPAASSHPVSAAGTAAATSAATVGAPVGTVVNSGSSLGGGPSGLPESLTALPPFGARSSSSMGLPPPPRSNESIWGIPGFSMDYNAPFTLDHNSTFHYGGSGGSGTLGLEADPTDWQQQTLRDLLPGVPIRFAGAPSADLRGPAPMSGMSSLAFVGGSGSGGNQIARPPTSSLPSYFGGADSQEAQRSKPLLGYPPYGGAAEHQNGAPTFLSEPAYFSNGSSLDSNYLNSNPNTHFMSRFGPSAAISSSVDLDDFGGERNFPPSPPQHQQQPSQPSQALAGSRRDFGFARDAFEARPEGYIGGRGDNKNRRPAETRSVW